MRDIKRFLYIGRYKPNGSKCHPYLVEFLPLGLREKVLRRAPKFHESLFNNIGVFPD